MLVITQDDAGAAGEGPSAEVEPVASPQPTASRVRAKEEIKSEEQAYRNVSVCILVCVILQACLYAGSRVLRFCTELCVVEPSMSTMTDVIVYAPNAPAAAMDGENVWSCDAEAIENDGPEHAVPAAQGVAMATMLCVQCGIRLELCWFVDGRCAKCESRRALFAMMDQLPPTPILIENVRGYELSGRRSVTFYGDTGELLLTRHEENVRWHECSLHQYENVVRRHGITPVRRTPEEDEFLRNEIEDFLSNDVVPSEVCEQCGSVNLIGEPCIQCEREEVSGMQDDDDSDDSGDDDNDISEYSTHAPTSSSEDSEDGDADSVEENMDLGHNIQ